LTTFYDTGKVDDSRYTYQPMDFYVKRGWTTQAKQYLAIAVAAIVLLFAGVVALIWFIVRRTRRRRAGQISS
jgi:flagellar biosynthesis/type III secretory pathway M-ring protein FliF/YscJ